MWRHGCLADETARDKAVGTIAHRHEQLCRDADTGTVRAVGAYEIESAWAWAVEHVAAKTDQQVADELGGHDHNADGARFFAKGIGLLASNLADAVMDCLTCGFNQLTGQFYVYENGVWRPEQARIESEIVVLLGNRYRNSHASNAMTLVRLRAPRIECEPVPGYINVRNGMVDWQTGELTGHDPDYLSTVQLPHDYDPDAVCPAVDEWLPQVVPAD